MNTQDLINLILMDMRPVLNREQYDYLSKVLMKELRNIKLVQESTELSISALSDNEIKLRMFAASKLAANRSPATIKQYVREIRNLLANVNKPVEEITTMDIRWYYSMLRQQGRISASTMQTRLLYISSFYEFLISEDVVTKNPAKAVGPVKVETIIKKPFTQEEMEKLRTTCTDIRDRAILEFLYSTGVRVSEMVALNVNDIMMDTQELIVYGKGSKERHTYLTDSAKFYLERYLELRKNEEDLESRPLFVTKDAPHNRLSISGVQNALKNLGKAAGVENVHPHRFRRTIATDLLDKGMPIEEVKDFLGHEEIGTTLIYSQVQQENVQHSHHKYA